MERLRKRWRTVLGVAVLCLGLFAIITPIAAASAGTNSSAPPAPFSKGKVILVSLAKEWLWAYDNGKLVFNTPVTTAKPGLVTPTGTWRIFIHKHPTIFHSPWPKGNPLYYPPTFINYAMEWHGGGYYIHDATWRSVFGPGTNVWHKDPVFGWESGSHGCINVSLKAAKFLYYWAPNGTIVKVVKR